MRGMICLLVGLATLPGTALAADPGTSPGANPGDTMRRIAASPYRYGGEISGLPLSATETDRRRSLHLAIGLSAPGPHGRLQGEAILFDAGRRLVATAPIDGSLVADPADRDDPTAGTGQCRLRFAFPDGETRLDGLCTRDTVSGEIVSQPARPDLLRRIVFWWGDRAVSGRAWLTAASFDPQPGR